jgi:segregation and condensation protein A
MRVRLRSTASSAARISLNSTLPASGAVSPAIVPSGGRSTLPRMRSAELELDLDVFAGPFDLLLAIVLREEISLLEVELGEVVLAYLERLEEVGELDLEAATEFLVLIAALLELKSRLMLPAEEDPELDLGPEEAAEELLARMLEYRRYKTAGAALTERLEAERPFLYRIAPLPPELRRVSVEAARPVYEPDALGIALGDLLRAPPRLDTSHIRPTVSLERRLEVLRDALSRGSALDFDEAFGSEDRLTQAVTIFALLELHKKGEASWSQSENFGPIEIVAGAGGKR